MSSSLHRPFLSTQPADAARDFNKTVNMTADELEKWLKGTGSKDSGWSKDDGSGESIGHERYDGPQIPSTPIDLLRSGRKIIQILKKNPKKDPSKYDKDELSHMRRVAAYNKRHLAQEEKAKQDTNSNSYKSLKNWGHDPLKS